MYLPVQTMQSCPELVSLLKDQMQVCHVLNSVYIAYYIKYYYRTGSYSPDSPVLLSFSIVYIG